MAGREDGFLTFGGGASQSWPFSFCLTNWECVVLYRFRRNYNIHEVTVKVSQIMPNANKSAQGGSSGMQDCGVSAAGDHHVVLEREEDRRRI